LACINLDGTLTEVARQVLSALTAPLTPEEVAARTGLPLYRIRATFRETGRAGLIEAADGGWRLTDLGREALELDS
jgi:hypothetical protein